MNKWQRDRFSFGLLFNAFYSYPFNTTPSMFWHSFIYDVRDIFQPTIAGHH